MARDLDELAFRFFKLFAQFEYALKAMGYGRAGRSGNAEPDWDRYSGKAGPAIMSADDAEIVAARRYMFEFPPKRQIWVDNVVEWEAVGRADESAQALFAHIRRVRNNLYHGGKFNGRWIDPDRSRELIDGSLVILEALRRFDHDLADAISGNHA